MTPLHQPPDLPPYSPGLSSTKNGDWLAGLPTWARIAFLLGVPSVIALGLSYSLTQNVARDLSAVKDATTTIGAKHEGHAAAMAAMDARVKDHALSSEYRSDEILLVLRQICSSMARDAVTRDRCFQTVPRR